VSNLFRNNLARVIAKDLKENPHYWTVIDYAGTTSNKWLSHKVIEGLKLLVSPDYNKFLLGEGIISRRDQIKIFKAYREFIKTKYLKDLNACNNKN
jgi:hypothetical protein